MPEKYQVVIVGGGPVGVALAVEFGLRGVTCALVERYHEPQRIPKGQNLTQRTLEHFYFWGIADELRAVRVMPAGFPASGIAAYGSLMGEYWAAPAQRELVGAYYFQENECLPQYHTEAVLRRKLASLAKVECLFGWSAETLVQTGDAVHVSIAEQGGSGRRIESDRQFLARYSPERDRAEFEHVWNERVAGVSMRVQTYEPHYEGSPVVIGPPGGRCSAHGRHTFAAKAGHHLPPQPLSSGRNVFEELGTGFTLLAFGADDGAVGAFEAAARALRIPQKVVRDSYTGGREAYGVRLILVRPDQYVVWTGDGAAGDARAVMAKVTGRKPAH